MKEYFLNEEDDLKLKEYFPGEDVFSSCDPCLHTDSRRLLSLPPCINYLTKDTRHDNLTRGHYDYMMWLEIRNRFIGDDLLDNYYE